MSDRTVYVIRIFVGKNGSFGSRVGILVDEKSGLSSTKRLEITRQLGFSETIFINDLKTANVSIYSKQGEIPFASPLLGAAWFIEKENGETIDEITCQENKIKVSHINDMIWLSLPDTSSLPPWELEQLQSAEEVEAIEALSRNPEDHHLVWAWEDEERGIVRARTFAPVWEIPEEEANGSGSMLLAHTLKRSVAVHHGQGSVINVNLQSGEISIGGLIVEDRSIGL